MKLLFFPTMGIRAVLKTFAPFSVTSDESPTLPVLTEFSIILEKVWLASKILEVVSVNALCFIMFMIKWAPLSFEVKNVEVIILIL